MNEPTKKLSGRKLEISQEAEARLERINGARKRIKQKIEGLPNDPRIPAWKSRLEEYDASEDILDFTIKTGRYVTLKGGEPGENDTVVNVPAGSVSTEGQTNGS